MRMRSVGELIETGRLNSAGWYDFAWAISPKTFGTEL